MLRDEVAAVEEVEVLEPALVEAADIEDEEEEEAEVAVEFEFVSPRPRASLIMRVPRLNASGSCFYPTEKSRRERPETRTKMSASHFSSVLYTVKN
jgi:hypothetical protein